MARAIIQGFAEQGGYTVTTDGRVSVTKVQRSFPGCTVSVFNAGTSTPSTIFSDVGGTPKANPFIASTDGYWFFYADDGSYDVTFSGAGISTPFTLFNFTIGQSGALNDPGSNGLLARTAPNTVTPRTIMGVTNETSVTDGNGVLGNPVVGLATFLEFTGKTLNGGTYLSPGIANFGSAQHSHSDAAGGGQMNATNVFSSGTVPVARLPIMVGASGGGNGVAGLVPQPLIADAGNFLRGDGVWATAGGGGGGTPGGASTTIQYNNVGAFGGVSGATSDGTNITFGSGNLRATSPRITTNILDANGNAILTLNAVGTSVNNIQLANAAAGGVPTFTAIGTDANINININPKGTGVIMSTGNFTLSNVAPQITLIDTNDSKQARLLLSGSNLSLVNDTAGVTPLNIDTVTSNITLSAGSGIVEALGGGIFRATGANFVGFQINKTAATARFLSMVIDGNNVRFNNAAGNDFFTCSFTNEVTTFSQIPVFPGSNPTTDNQGARKAYVDSKTNWSAGFFIADPSTFPLNSFNLCQKIIVSGSVTRARDIQLIFGTGTASGSFVVEVRKHPFGDQTTQTVLGTLTINPGTLGVGTSVDIADHTFTNGDYLYIILTSRSSPLQRDVSITVTGDKLG